MELSLIQRAFLLGDQDAMSLYAAYEILYWSYPVDYDTLNNLAYILLYKSSIDQNTLLNM